MKLSDFFLPAWRCSDPQVRALAVRKLRSDARLAAIARRDTDFGVVSAAIEALRDPALLAEIATSAADISARTRAIARVDDPAVLERIARSGENGYMREVAVRWICNPAVLQEIAGIDEVARVRDAAESRWRTVTGAKGCVREPQPEEPAGASLADLGEPERSRALASIPELAGFEVLAVTAGTADATALRELLLGLPIVERTHPSLAERHLDHDSGRYFLPRDLAREESSVDAVVNAPGRSLDYNRRRPDFARLRFQGVRCTDQLLLVYGLVFHDGSRLVTTACVLRIGDDAWLHWSARIDKG